MRTLDPADSIDAAEARRLTRINERAKDKAEFERYKAENERKIEEDRALCEKFRAAVWPTIRAAINDCREVAWLDVPSLQTGMDPVSSVIADLRKLGYRAETTVRCYGTVLVIGWRLDWYPE